MAILRSEALLILRMRPAWGLALGILLLGTAALALPDQPFHQQGIFCLQAFSGLDQFLAAFLAGAAILSAPALRGTSWWPVSTSSRLIMMGAGRWLAAMVLMAMVVLLQLLGALLVGEAAALDPLSPEPLSLVPRYGEMLVLGGCYAMVLMAWGILLGSLLGRAAALMLLIGLMLTGFLVGGLAQGDGGVSLLLFFVPDLAALAPVQASSGVVPDLGPRAVYALIHALFVLSASGLINDIIESRGGRGAA